MIPPPSLELLEDRRLLSGAYGLPPVVPLPGVLSGEYSRALEYVRTVDNGSGLFAMRIGLEGIEGNSLFERLGLSPSEAFVLHRESERETLSSLMSSLENDAHGNSIEIGSFVVRSSVAWETPAAAFNDRSQTGAEPSAQPSALPSGAIADSLSSLGNIVPGDASTDLAASGPFADAVFLDGWPDGLPAPQVDLVPAANKDLTIIAAYLVGSPVAAPAPAVPPASGTEAGSTDFIVGLQPARPESSPAKSVARESSPITLDLIPATAPAHTPTAVEPQTCAQPPDFRHNAPVGRQDTNADHAPPSGSESADMPEETSDDESAE